MCSNTYYVDVFSFIITDPTNQLLDSLSLSDRARETM